jgi:hypothetical protein
MLLVQLGINSTRDVWKFGKLDSPRRPVQFWQNFQTSLVLLIPNCTRHRMIAVPVPFLAPHYIAVPVPFLAPHYILPVSLSVCLFVCPCVTLFASIRFLNRLVKIPCTCAKFIHFCGKIN